MGNGKTDMQFRLEILEKRRESKRRLEIAKAGRIEELIAEYEKDIEIYDTVLQVPEDEKK